jgi:hypothetical protein
VVGTEGKVHLLDLETGRALWRLDDLEPIGLCGDTLLTHELGARSYQVHAYDLSGRRLWQVGASRSTDTRFCVSQDGFYAWPSRSSPKGSRRSVDFHPIGEPDSPRELEGPADYSVERLEEQSGWLACYRWGEGPSHCAVYYERQPIWNLDHQGSNTPEIWADEEGWVMCTYDESQAWSSQGQHLWTAPGLKRRWIDQRWLVGEGIEGIVAIDRSSGESHRLLQGGLRDLALAGEQVWWLNWESFGCQQWTYPLAELGIWARTSADRLVAYAGRLFLGGSDGSVACFGPACG